MDFIDNQRIEATFCFVDITGYTALTETRGEVAAADLVSLFVTLVAHAVGDRGKVLEHIGDAALFCCPEPSHAIEAVTELYRTSAQVPHFPALRGGLHTGGVLHRDGRFYGTTINLASRVAAQAQPGHVFSTADIAYAASKLGITVRPLGPYTLKNLAEPVELFDLEVVEHGTDQHIDPVCRAIIRQGDDATVAWLDGEEHWFCSHACLERFLRDPSRYRMTVPTP